MTPRLQSREIVALVAIKLVALAAIYALFFGPAHRPAVDASAHLLGAGAPSTSSR